MILLTLRANSPDISEYPRWIIISCGFPLSAVVILQVSVTIPVEGIFVTGDITVFSQALFADTVSSLGFSLVGVGTVVGLALLFSCFVKIVTVLSMLRVGLGVGSVPGFFVTTGLAISLSFFVMAPEIESSLKAVNESLKSSNGVSESAKSAAFEAGISKWRLFVQKQTEPEDAKRFVELAVKIDSGRGRTANPESISALADSWRVLAPAFVISELRRGFSTGLKIFLPFLVIELLVAVTLAALGVERLSPTLVGFPLKILVFVMLDGWTLITSGLVSSYI